MRFPVRVVIVLVFMILTAGAANAQFGGTLDYGGAAIGRVGSESPSLLYGFEGQQGESIVARVLSMAPGMTLSLTLVDANQQPVAVGQGTNAFGDAALGATLPESAAYSLVVSLLGGGAGGEFLLQLGIDPGADSALPLPAGSAQTIDLPAGISIQSRAFTVDATCPTVLMLVNASPDGARYSARMVDQTGTARAISTSAPREQMTFAPGAGAFTLQLAPAVPTQAAAVTVALGCEGEVPGLSAASIAPPPEPTFAPPAGSVMMIASGGSLVYGQGVLGTILEGTPLISYSFQGSVGDRIEAQALGFSPDTDVTLALLSPAVQPIAFNDSHPFSVNPTDARVTYVLPESGVYSLLVATNNPLGGAYVLRLQGGPPDEAIALEAAPTTIAVETSRFPSRYAIPASECPLVITLSAQGGTAPARVVMEDDRADTSLETLLAVNSLASHEVSVPASTSGYGISLVSAEGSATVAISTACDEG